MAYGLWRRHGDARYPPKLKSFSIKLKNFPLKIKFWPPKLKKFPFDYISTHLLSRIVSNIILMLLCKGRSQASRLVTRDSDCSRCRIYKGGAFHLLIPSWGRLLQWLLWGLLRNFLGRRWTLKLIARFCGTFCFHTGWAFIGFLESQIMLAMPWQNGHWSAHQEFGMSHMPPPTWTKEKL